MRRREFIAGLGGATAWPLAARAQQPGMPVIGFLVPGKRDRSGVQCGWFPARPERSRLLRRGRNLAIEYRWAEGQYDRLPDLAADLVRRQVALIVATGSPNSAQAAKAATMTI
jgi:putative ABC transport system substrate-binding protein